MYWVVFSDLDGTLWDHMDISSLTPPFKRIDRGTIIDSRGVRVRVYDEMIHLLIAVKECGAIVSSLSWNNPRIALEAINTLGLDYLFDYHLIANHPFKYILALQLLDVLKTRYYVEPELVVYLDDRDIHLSEMRSFISNLLYLRPWLEFRTHTDALQAISVSALPTVKSCLLENKQNRHRKELALN